MNRALLGCSHQGEIRLQKDYALDFELSPLIHLVVLADNGLQTTHCRVSVHLLDVNDNAPRFEYSSYRTAVWEGQAHNTYVMQVDPLMGFWLSPGVRACCFQALFGCSCAGVCVGCRQRAERADRVLHPVRGS